MEENYREYTNGEITVYWRPSKCIHATTCFRELRSVFNPSKRPWVNMNGAETDEIIRIVELCPTDALTYSYNDKIINQSEDIKDIDEIKDRRFDDIQPATQVEIRIMQNGPLIVKGEFITIGEDGQQLKNMKIASFCRCGHSLNMPYCDGMHRKIGWKS